ncbi:MAG: kelch repeat-containing protein [Pirellulaceae bacterium]
MKSFWWNSLVNYKRKSFRLKSQRNRNFVYESLENRQLLAGIVWSTGPSLASPVADGLAVLGTDDSVYLMDGENSSVQGIDVLDTEWWTAPNIDKQRTGLGGGVQSDGHVFIFGGANGGEPIEESYRYDPLDIDPQDGPSMSTTRAYAAFATDPGSGLIFAIGGVNADGSVINSVESYDPLTQSWATRTALPTALADASAVADGTGNLFVFGGRRAGFGSNDATNSVYRYSIATNSWQLINTTPIPLRNATAVAGPNNGIAYLIGGQNNTNAALDTVFAFEFATGTWVQETTLPVAVRDASASLDAEGHLMLIGGRNNLGQTVDSVFITQDLDAQDSAPTIVSSPSLTATASLQYTYQLFANGNPQPTFALTSAPEGMTIDSHGLVHWTPTETQVGEQNVSVRAINRAGEDIQSFSIQVASAIPHVVTQPITTGATGVAYTYDVDATGNPAPQYNLLEYPVGMQINSQTGVISWLPSASQFGDHNVVVVANNANGQDQQSFTVTVADSIAPTSPVNFQVTDLTTTVASFSWTAATDNAAIAKYQLYSQYKYGWRYSKTGYRLIKDNILETSTSMEGLTPGANYKYVVRSVDTSGNMSTNSNLVTFKMKLPPAVFGPATTTAIATHPMSVLTFRAIGNPIPTLSLVSAPGGFSFDPSNGTGNWTPSDSQVGTHEIIVRAENSEGFSDYTTTVTVNANRPTVTTVFSYSGVSFSTPFAIEGESFDLMLVDKFSNSKVTWSIVSGPSNMSIDSTMGGIKWTPLAEHVGTLPLVFRATNYAGSTDFSLNIEVLPWARTNYRQNP